MKAEPNKKKDPSSVLARSQPMKSHGSFVYSSCPSCLFLSMKAFSFPCCQGTCMCFLMVADPKLRFFTDTEYTLFCCRNIWQSICFRSPKTKSVYLGSRQSKQFCNLNHYFYFVCLYFRWYLFYMIVSEVAHLNMIKINESCPSLALCLAYHMVHNNQSVSFSAQLHFDGDWESHINPL